MKTYLLVWQPPDKKVLKPIGIAGPGCEIDSLKANSIKDNPELRKGCWFAQELTETKWFRV